MLVALILFLHVLACTSLSFQLPDFFGSLPKVPSPPSISVQKQKAAILEAISYTNNGRDATSSQQATILGLVQTLETTKPPPPDLLTDSTQAQILNGTWFLQYTSPSKAGDENAGTWQPAGDPTEGAANIETKQFTAKGSISAAGVTVDASNRCVEQTFDVATKRVVNRVFTDWGVITVEGSFRISSQVPNRAVVAFDNAEIQVGDKLILNLSFVFGILSFVRNSKESGWLETTYVDDDVRVGRGNKGSLFVLTRDPEAVGQ